jgi:hypothetical protein
MSNAQWNLFFPKYCPQTGQEGIRDHTGAVPLPREDLAPHPQVGIMAIDQGFDQLVEAGPLAFIEAAQRQAKIGW